MSELPGDVVSSIHNPLPKARSEAEAIEGPSRRRAVGSLADATADRLGAALAKAG